MIDALVAAARSQLQPRMLGLVLWPLLGSLLLWGLVSFLFWHRAMQAMHHFTPFAPVNDFLMEHGLSWVTGSLVWLALGFLLPTLVVATALFITSVVAMPIMVEHVAARDYPQLARSKGGTTLGSILNALGALVVYLLLWALILPLWLAVPFAFILPIVLNGYLNDRVFRYDAFAEHATEQEYREILRRRNSQLFGLGIIAALIQLVPFVNLVSPVYSGLSFIHFALAELEKSRAAKMPSASFPALR